MSTYVVTGCAGFIGARLSERLISHGHDVIGIDNLTNYYAPSIKKRRIELLREHDEFEYHRSALERMGLIDLFGRASGIYHLAAQPGVQSSWGIAFSTYTRLNVLATQ